MASENDYRDLILKLLPRGRAWTRDADSWTFKFAAAMGVELSRVDGRISDLLREIDPRFTSELLTEFESELGLPDDCSVIGNSVEQRRADIVARQTAYGGQSFAYFEDVLLNAGTSISISQQEPFRVGHRVGERLKGPGYRYIWFVDVPVGTLSYFTVGESTAGDPLASVLDDTNVLCFLNKNKPAHTYIVFTFS